MSVWDLRLSLVDAALQDAVFCSYVQGQLMLHVCRKRPCVPCSRSTLTWLSSETRLVVSSERTLASDRTRLKSCVPTGQRFDKVGFTDKVGPLRLGLLAGALAGACLSAK